MNKSHFSSASDYKGTHREKVMQTVWLNNHRVPGAQPGIHMPVVNVFKCHFCPQQHDDITQEYRHYQKLAMESWFSETRGKGSVHWTGSWGGGVLNQPMAFKAVQPMAFKAVSLLLRPPNIVHTPSPLPFSSAASPTDALASFLLLHHPFCHSIEGYSKEIKPRLCMELS